jgi:succinoglycan biosynthesis protein ExoA
MKNLPFVSVVMPVRDEASYIGRSIGSVLSQDYPADRMEIIVADGLSADGTRDVIASLQLANPHIKLIDNPGRIVPTGLNLAIAMARGEYIIRVDGHCEVEKDYVRNCVTHLSRGEVAGVGGPIETIGETKLAEVIALAMRSRFGIGGATFRTGVDKDTFTDTIAFPAYSRAAIERAGPYDEQLVRNQDDEFNSRLRKLGERLLLATNVRSRYYSRSSFRSLWRQYYEYGFWKVRVIQKHPYQVRPRQFAPPLFVATLLFTLALSPFSTFAFWIFSVAIVTYVTASILATLLLTGKVQPRGLTLLPIVFAILHVSYGTGFLVGVFKFIRPWRERQGPQLEPMAKSSNYKHQT